jgi:hypothetical protein
VFPRKLVPGRRDGVNYDLFAANGSTNPTYGWISVSLNLGLRRDFTWRFVVADVQTAIIGIDLLSHFGLLVDCETTDFVTESRQCPHRPNLHEHRYRASK